jgi:hypothetical protein
MINRSSLRHVPFKSSTNLHFWLSFSQQGALKVSDTQGLAGNAGDLELTFQLEAGWGRRMEQESG